MGKVAGFIAAIWGAVFLAARRVGTIKGVADAVSDNSTFHVPTVAGTATVETANLAPLDTQSIAQENAVTDFIKNVEAELSTIFGTKYDTQINAAALKYNVPADYLYKLLYEESRYREDIINGTTRSSAGALGIAQFMPATAREVLGSEAAALDPNIAIDGAAKYLAQLKSQLGSWTKAVAAYNWGIGNVQRKGLANAPAETVNYVAAITGDNIKA